MVDHLDDRIFLTEFNERVSITYVVVQSLTVRLQIKCLILFTSAVSPGPAGHRLDMRRVSYRYQTASTVDMF